MLAIGDVGGMINNEQVMKVTRGGAMILTDADKRRIKKELADCLSREGEIRKIIIFGSFINSDQPRDIDVAVVQDSAESYLTLALKYRRLARPVADQIPLDLVPLKAMTLSGALAPQINRGEVIYER